MLKSLVLAGALLCALTINADAKPRRVIVADPGCNVIFPCEGVSPSVRGERVVKAMGGLGSARKVYTPRSSAIVAHPPGCPTRAFCGCGAAVRIFGKPVRALWRAAKWFQFPRAAPSPGMAAVRRHHVFVLEQSLGGNTWLVYDANSGGHATRIHARSILGYVIVNPRAG